jgi:hypothetical protein
MCVGALRLLDGRTKGCEGGTDRKIFIHTYSSVEEIGKNFVYGGQKNTFLVSNNYHIRRLSRP